MAYVSQRFRGYVAGHSCSHMWMLEESGCSVLIPAPVMGCNFYIEFYE